MAAGNGSLEPRKKPSYFPLNPGWLIGILTMVYYNPHITGQYNPLYNPNNQGFFHCSLEAPNLSQVFRNRFLQLQFGDASPLTRLFLRFLNMPCFMVCFVRKKTRPHSGPKERQPNARNNFFFPRSTKVILLHLCAARIGLEATNKQQTDQTNKHEATSSEQTPRQ